MPSDRHSLGFLKFKHVLWRWVPGWCRPPGWTRSSVSTQGRGHWGPLTAISLDISPSYEVSVCKSFHWHSTPWLTCSFAKGKPMRVPKFSCIPSSRLSEPKISAQRVLLCFQHRDCCSICSHICTESAYLSVLATLQRCPGKTHRKSFFLVCQSLQKINCLKHVWIELPCHPSCRWGQRPLRGPPGPLGFRPYAARRSCHAVLLRAGTVNVQDSAVEETAYLTIFVWSFWS